MSQDLYHIYDKFGNKLYKVQQKGTSCIIIARYKGESYHEGEVLTDYRQEYIWAKIIPITPLFEALNG